MASREKLFKPREAAQVLGISYPTLKQWIYKGKVRTIRTAGGHHRVPEKEIDKFLHRSFERKEFANVRAGFRLMSGRNQLIGRVTDVQIDGLMAQVTLSISGQRIASIITADAAREMRLKPGRHRRSLHQVHRSDDHQELKPAGLLRSGQSMVALSHVDISY